MFINHNINSNFNPPQKPVQSKAGRSKAPLDRKYIRFMNIPYLHKDENFRLEIKYLKT